MIDPRNSRTIFDHSRTGRTRARSPSSRVSTRPGPGSITSARGWRARQAARGDPRWVNRAGCPRTRGSDPSSTARTADRRSGGSGVTTMIRPLAESEFPKPLFCGTGRGPSPRPPRGGRYPSTRRCLACTRVRAGESVGCSPRGGSARRRLSERPPSEVHPRNAWRPSSVIAQIGRNGAPICGGPRDRGWKGVGSRVVGERRSQCGSAQPNWGRRAGPPTRSVGHR